MHSHHADVSVSFNRFARVSGYRAKQRIGRHRISWWTAMIRGVKRGFGFGTDKIAEYPSDVFARHRENQFATTITVSELVQRDLTETAA